MLNQFSRLELAIGKEGIEVLKQATVAVIGIGGVGSYAVEALARSGIGSLILIDKDVVDITNINRQLHATLHTIGDSKSELMKARVESINPACQVIALNIFYTPETADWLFSFPLDYIADAADTISSKIHVINESFQRKIPIISSMGAANKTDPTRFEVADISKTSYDPIAKIVRQKLKKEHKIQKGVKVVYSKEIPVKQREDIMQEVSVNPLSSIRKAKMPPSSNAFVPSVVGLIMAGVIVNDLLSHANIKINRVNH